MSLTCSPDRGIMKNQRIPINGSQSAFFKKLFPRVSWKLWLIGLLCVINWHCSDDTQAKKTCKLDEHCATDELCTFLDPACRLTPYKCEGFCEKKDKEPKKCLCKTDSQCNFPLEACANCKCYKRQVKECKLHTDCGQGYICKGNEIKVCELREVCTEAKDCLPGLKCHEGRCCNPSAGKCPRECKIGMGCQNDGDCVACQMKCRNGVCEAASSCLGKKCVDSKECAACGAICKDNICQQGQTNCSSRTCKTNQECTFVGLKQCLNGCCR